SLSLCLSPNPTSTLVPYTTLFRSEPYKRAGKLNNGDKQIMAALFARQQASFQTNVGADSSVRFDAITTSPFTTGLGNDHPLENGDRKSTRLNSSHVKTSYAVLCLT